MTVELGLYVPSYQIRLATELTRTVHRTGRVRPVTGEQQAILTKLVAAGLLVSDETQTYTAAPGVKL